MSEAVKAHPLEMEKERFGIKEPEARFDTQGEVADDERVRRAMVNFAKDINRTTATYMEACVHCGQCAEACHYYVQTGDPKYTPIHKLEPMRRVWSQEYTFWGRLARRLGLAQPVPRHGAVLPAQQHEDRRHQQRQPDQPLARHRPYRSPPG